MIIIPKRKWTYPLSQERTYCKILRSYVSHITAAMNASIADMRAAAEKNGFKFDSYESDLDALLKKIEARIDKRVAEQAILRRIEQMYGSVNSFNKSEFKEIIHSAVGAEDFFINEKWQKTAQAVWVQENINLIRSIKSQTLEKIRYQMGDMILNAQGKQLRTAELSAMIQDISNKNRSRADLIARDQIGKLNGRLTQLRQQSAGIKEYVWSTSRDERVRKAHAEREGKTFKWSDPPSDGNPGYPIRCRCVAVPVIDTETLGIAEPVAPEEKPKNAIMKVKRNYNNKLATALGKNHYDAAHDILDSDKVPVSIKKLWQRYEDEIGIDTVHATDGKSYAHGHLLHINIEDVAAGDAIQVPYQTLYHECGHAIDSLVKTRDGERKFLTRVSSRYKDGAFIEAIHADVDSLIEKRTAVLKAEFQKRKKANDVEWFRKQRLLFAWDDEIPSNIIFKKAIVYRDIAAELRSYDIKARGNVCDMFEGATKGKILSGIGHGGAYYWRERTVMGIEYGLGTEAFAEFTDSFISNPASLALMKKYLPTAYKTYLEMIDYILEEGV